MSVAIRAAAVLFVAVLTAVAAQVSIPLPFTPVPFTLQPMIVLVGGAELGARLGPVRQPHWMQGDHAPCSLRDFSGCLGRPAGF